MHYSDCLKPFRLFKLKVPFYLFLIALFGIILIFSIYIRSLSSAALPVVSGLSNTMVQTYRSVRNSDFSYTKPILFIENNEASDLDLLKQKISSYIQGEQLKGTIRSASVIFRDLNNARWMTINKDKLYSPGSLMKVPTMMTYLKQSETEPGLMDREIFFKQRFTAIPEQTITGPKLVEGKNYKIKELLKYMIEYSDNDATALLNMNISFSTMQKLFSTLQLPVPELRQPDYLIGVEDCSRFFITLYNGSYLNFKDSEFALEMMTKSAYRNGLISGIDSTIPVAHKFGERNNNGEQQFHEFGIFYLNNHVYLLGVMTKGNDHEKLPAIIGNVSKIVFNEINAGKGT